MSDSESDCDIVQPIGQIKHSKTVSYQLKSFYDQYLSSKNTSNNIDLDPDYQREFVWSMDKQSLLIDSIMKSYIIPPFIIRIQTKKVGDKKIVYRECVDGQHRLKVIKNFIENTAITDDLITWNLVKKLDTKSRKVYEYVYYKKAPEKHKHRVMTTEELEKFNNFQLVCYEIQCTDDRQIREIFDRLQQGAQVAMIERFKNVEHPVVLKIKQAGFFKEKFIEENKIHKIAIFLESNASKVAKRSSFIFCVIRIIFSLIYKKISYINYSIDLNVKKSIESKSKNLQIENPEIIDPAIQIIIEFIGKCREYKIKRLNRCLFHICLFIYAIENIENCMEKIKIFLSENRKKYNEELSTKVKNVITGSDLENFYTKILTQIKTEK